MLLYGIERINGLKKWRKEWVAHLEIASILDCTSASTSSDFELSNRWNNSCVSNISLLVWWYRASIADAGDCREERTPRKNVSRLSVKNPAASVRVLNVTDNVISDNHVVLHHGLGRRSADGRTNEKLFFCIGQTRFRDNYHRPPTDVSKSVY